MVSIEGTTASAEDEVAASHLIVALNGVGDGSDIVDKVKKVGKVIAWIRNREIRVNAHVIVPQAMKEDTVVPPFLPELYGITCDLIDRLVGLGLPGANVGQRSDAMVILENAFDRVRDLERAACRKAWFDPAREQALALRVKELEGTITRVLEDYLRPPTTAAVMPKSGSTAEFYMLHYEQACAQMKQAASALSAALPKPVEIDIDV